MKIAITGGTGFVGGHLARRLRLAGHEVVIIARSSPLQAPEELQGATVARVGLDDPRRLAEAFAGCDAVAHCAGINREIGGQTYERVHIRGTRHVIDAARAAGVKKVVAISFLRARPGCGSGYHESKFEAEEIVRQSGLDFTVLKPGVIYGKGDHMIDHLARAFLTFPFFGLVGYQDQWVCPVAVEDVVTVLEAALVEGRLSNQTVAVLGPERMTLREAVSRVARRIGRRPRMVRFPVRFHYLLGWAGERVMTVPLVSVAQVRILSEGLIEPAPKADRLPADLTPLTLYNEESIGRGLPRLEPFGLRDLRLCRKEGQP
jgi:uncharacterized protein YbjT (DUF2867 family)